MNHSHRDLDRLGELLLVRGAQQGQAEAFRTLVDAYEQRLLYFIRRILGEEDRSLDVLQDVWLTVIKRLSSLQSAEAFRVWLYRIARDKAVDAVRGRQREREVLADIAESLPDEPAGPIEPGFATENIELIHHALGLLSAAHREVLTLRFLEDMSLEEVSQVVGCPIGTVKSRLHHAQRLLRHQIEELNHA
ncbi:MAG: sigma-70 family RNA polymerase sigma factor [Planctomycetota bacterium]|nr:MAG: sigma-70 family RNA polymerase sigma factor [Planctomycetota bacterium]